MNRARDVGGSRESQAGVPYTPKAPSGASGWRGMLLRGGGVVGDLIHIVQVQNPERFVAALCDRAVEDVGEVVDARGDLLAVHGWAPCVIEV